jgi:RNA-directed DNA polymerase
MPQEQHAYRQNRNAQSAVREVRGLLASGHKDVVDADLSGYLDVASYCPQIHEVLSNRLG